LSLSLGERRGSRRLNPRVVARIEADIANWRN
jgi:hypothetical protein